jgi:hypothetical protein
MTWSRYVAGIGNCSDLGGGYNGRASEPWRSYSGMLYSGLLNKSTVADIVAYNQRFEKLSHLGIWGGVGGFRNQLMSFTEQGHGWGLIQNDMVDEFVLQLYSEMAHDCTRGSWTCFVSDRHHRHHCHHPASARTRSADGRPSPAVLAIRER